VERVSDVASTGSPGVGRTASAAVLRRLELDISRRLDGILHGDHRGLVPGHGSELGEARIYEPGDDVRRIDWNVTARTAVTHIRETIADRELECWLVVDRSASLDFGTAAEEKRDVVLAAAAGVGILTARGGNRVGAMVVDSNGAATIPPRQGRKHLMSILSRIEGSGRADGSPSLSLKESLDRVRQLARRRGLVVVLSDFVDPPEDWRHSLAAIATRHEVLCIEVVDPRELQLPNAGVLTLVDAETGRVREIDTRRRKVRDAYATAAADHRQAVASAVHGTGADLLRLDTNGDWLGALVAHVERRRRRSANVGGVTRQRSAG
jgi:uncharacterized protein (DUF58 family)